MLHNMFTENITRKDKLEFFEITQDNSLIINKVLHFLLKNGEGIMYSTF
jgi:hypothetical protein